MAGSNPGRSRPRPSQSGRTARADENAAGNTSPSAPVIGAGMQRWIETVTVLRDNPSQIGWSHKDPQNQSISESPFGEYKILVAAGNKNTGNPDSVQIPRAARKRGQATAKFVEFRQQTIPGLAELFSGRPVPTDSASPPHRGLGCCYPSRTRYSSVNTTGCGSLVYRPWRSPWTRTACGTRVFLTSSWRGGNSGARPIRPRP